MKKRKKFFREFKVKKVKVNNVLNIDLSDGYNFYLTNLSGDIIPLVYPYGDKTSPEQWTEFQNIIHKEVIPKIIPDGGDIYTLHNSSQKSIMTIDCIDFSKVFDRCGRSWDWYSVVDEYRKMNSERTNQ